MCVDAPLSPCDRARARPPSLADLLPPRPLLSRPQNGFGDVAYIGWVPLDLYRESGAKMRSAKEAHRDWPVPRQPEEAGLATLFGEQLVEEDAEVERNTKERFRIQW